VVHRDIKPDNIMMTKHGGVKVVDFGIAKVDDPDSKLTATGMMVGTPNYISPEVCLGQDVDARSDIFSLGIVFFEMLAGETPFKADSPIAMMTAVVQAEVPDIRTLNPEVDEDVRQILSHMLHKQREFRYQGCQEIIDDLTAYLEGNEPPYATAAMEDATVAMHRPDIAADTVAAGAPQPVVRPKSAPRAKRAGQLGWVLGLLLIVGAAAGSWYYVEQPVGDDARESASLAAQVTGEAVAVPDDGVETATGVAAALPGLEPQGSVPIPAEAISSGPVQQAGHNAGRDLAQDPLQAEVAVPAEQPSPRTLPAAPVEIEPPQPVGPPQLVVIANGDPSISTVVESVLEGALLAADFQVMDESFFNGLRIGGFNADLVQMGQSVRANGGDVLIFADVRETGTRTLSFYGRSELQILANLQVRALLLREKRNLGAPWLASLEYVPLNASDTAREVAEPIADELVERLQAITQ
jgi:serine/threonine-protein kinase